MSRLTIKEFCDQHSQGTAAEIIGCSQGNISQIINEGRREIYFELQDDGSYSWMEIKRTKKGATAA